MVVRMTAREDPVVVQVTKEALIVHLRGWRRILAFQRGVRIPWEWVIRVDYDPYPKGRVPTGFRHSRYRQTPGLFRYGSYHGIEGWSFWAVGSGKGALIIECNAGRYRYVVVETKDPQVVLAQVQEARKHDPRSSPGDVDLES
jgi:hypothetical protein